MLRTVLTSVRLSGHIVNIVFLVFDAVVDLADTVSGVFDTVAQFFASLEKEVEYLSKT